MKLKFEFTLEQVNAIIQTLAEGQFKVVQPLIEEFQKQGNQQLQAVEKVDLTEEVN